MHNCKTFSELAKSIGYHNMNMTIETALGKTWDIVHGFPLSDGAIYNPHKEIMVSVSGGADSDIMIDMVERVGYPVSNVRYVFFDTGVEFQATKIHLIFLELKYGIKIERHKAPIPVPVGVKKYGVPFLSKRVSGYISRLQKHGFAWEDEDFETLLARYPKCKAALRWWCNAWGENSQMNIARNTRLREFMILNPPQFRISDGCCDGAKKKKIGKSIEAEVDCNLQGLRKAEGGARGTAYKSCFDEQTRGGIARLRPIFWFTNSDKELYEKAFGVTHSKCYSLYGLPRTGCACCPFGRGFEHELSVAEKYEPKLHRAAVSIFGESYDYTRRYRDFQAEMKRGAK